MRSRASGQPHHPAVRIGLGAALDADQPLAQPRGQLPRAAAADGELTVPSRHAPDRCHHRRGAAGEGFDQPARRGVVAPLVERVALLANSQPLLACQRQEAVAGDPGQDRAAERRGSRACRHRTRRTGSCRPAPRSSGARRHRGTPPGHAPGRSPRPAERGWQRNCRRIWPRPSRRVPRGCSRRTPRCSPPGRPT